MDILIENVTIMFPELFEPKRFQGTGEPEYSATFTIDPEKNRAVLEKVKAAIAAAAKEKWKDQAAEVMRALVAQNKVCLHNGDEKANQAGFAGMMFIKANSKKPPEVLDIDGETPLTAAARKFHSGAIVNAGVSIWAMDNKYGKRICCSLLGVQFVDAGERLDGVSADLKKGFFPKLGEVAKPAAEEKKPSVMAGLTDEMAGLF